MAQTHFHTRDLGEAVETVGHVYCPHRLSLDRRAGGIDTTLKVTGSSRQPVVRLRYGAPVAVDAGDFPDLFLIMRCLDGSGSVRQGSAEANWAPGITVPVSANLGTEFGFGAEFSQATVKPDKQRLEALCGSWLGHPLDEPLRFALQPFSASLEAAWSSTLGLLDGIDMASLPPLAEASLQEFMLTLLLQGHPHNFSDELARPVQPLPSRLVRRARAYMLEHVHEPLTVATVAQALDVSVRALQAGFRSSHDASPMSFLRDLRLQRARQALLDAEGATSVTDVALESGFVHLGRFSGQYRAAFGESPAQTLARARRLAAGRRH